MSPPIATARAIFDQAYEIASPTERQAFLDIACAGNAALRREVEGLLRAADEAGSFLARPALALNTSFPDRPGSTGDSPPQGPLTSDHQSTEQVDDLAIVGPGTRIGPYTLVRLLGQGGMGAVYLARQEEPILRDVAIKIIRPGLAGDHVLHRFQFERQTLNALNHPHIARLLEAGTTSSGQPYFVMEFVPGKNLTAYCDDGKLSVRARLELFVLLCQAVQHAHSRGILHRDLKPGNVLVAADEAGKPLPRIIDFGLARSLEQRPGDQPQLTQEGVTVGTPAYMSPEQAGAAGGLTAQTDVYSLGVILYELLTGTTPLDGPTLRGLNWLDILDRIRNEEPPAPSKRVASLGDRLPKIAAARQIEPAQLPRLLRGELDWIALKALHKDLAIRYDTASGLARDVERYLNDEPVEASPPSLRYQLGKFARKNRLLLGSAVSILLLLIVGIVGLSVALAVVDGMRQRAERSERASGSLLDVSDAAVGVLLRDPRKLDGPETQRIRAIAEELQQTLLALGDEPVTWPTAARGYARLARLYLLLQDRDHQEATLRRAVELLEALHHNQPDDPAYRRMLGRCCYDLGVVLQFRKQLSEAETQYRRAMELMEQQRDLAIACNNLGVILRDRGDLEGAEQALRQAVAVGEPLLADSNDQPLREVLAATCHNLGNAIRDRGNVPASLPWYGKAIDLLTATKLTSKAAVEFLRNAYWDRATAQGLLKQHAVAVADWQRAIPLATGPTRKHLELFQAGDQAEARLTGERNPSPEQLHATALLLARAGLAATAESEAVLIRRYKARCLELLHQASRADLYRKPPYMQQLRDDPALSKLLGSAYPKLLQELQGKTLPSLP